MKILVVDDNTENIDMTSIILRSQNYEVDSATNGREALEKLHANKYDMVISDILMPAMDGFQLCKACKKDNQLKNLLFIFYTATYVDSKDEELALSLGAHKFIRKPQEPEDFLSLVKEVIERSENEESNGTDKPIHDEKEVLKLYSERLVKKLEKKNFDLENEIAFRKKIEKELIAAKEKAEESDRLKTAFLANISHEIRTPLNGMVGFAGLLSSSLPAEKLTDYINIIKSSGDHLLKIIEDILEMSRIETSLVVLEEMEFNLGQFIREVYTTYFELYRVKKPEIKFTLHLNEKLNDVNITADRVKLKQILSNLLENAFKFTNKGEIIFFCSVKDDAVNISVKDTGIGISEESQEIIFEHFRQAHEKINQLYGGTGLGLAICKNLIELMKGKIWVISQPEKGSEFKFTVPVIFTFKEKKIRKKDQHKNEINLQGVEIIVAEDDNVNFLLMKNYLSKTNCTLYHADDGLKVWDLINKYPDTKLILMDIKMPVMNGIEVIKLLRSHNINIPVIAQTAYTFDYEKTTLLDIGFDDYISKPIEKNNLLSVLSRHIIKS